MALAVARRCVHPRCEDTATIRGRCATHALQVDHQRPNVDLRKLYRTVRWRQLRAVVLHEEPLCCDCLLKNRMAPSTDVDHQEPHRGDLEKFWNRANLRARCHACHSRKTQRGE